MKINKIFQKLFQPNQTDKKVIPPCPVIYDSKNVTLEEFKQYVHWLAENNINRTFYEPDKFVTKAEREALKKKETELDEYRAYIKHLSETNSNRTFYTKG